MKVTIRAASNFVGLLAFILLSSQIQSEDYPLSHFELNRQWETNTSRPISIVHSSSDAAFSRALEEIFKGDQVEISWMDQSELKSKLASSTAKQAVPDVIIASSDLLGLSKTVAFSEIPESWKIKLQSQETLLSGLNSNDGKLYGLPIAKGNSLVLYYNKNYITNPARNWNELITQKPMLPDSVSLVGWPVLEMYWQIPFITAFGPEPVVNDHVKFDPQSLDKSFEFVWHLIDSKVVSPNCDYQCSVDNFLNGKLAYIISGTWELGQFDEVLGDQLGVTTLPEIDGNPMRPYYNTFLVMFPRRALSGENGNKIARLAQKLQSEVFYNKLAKSYSLQPINWHGQLNGLSKREQELHASTHKALELAVPIPHTQATFFMWEALMKGFVRTGGGAISNDAIYEYVQTYVNDQTSTAAQ